MTGTPAIEARDLAVEYERTRDRSRVTALKGFSITVQPGEFVAIVGPSGCGKSTFLNVVAGLHPPSQGEVRVGGQPVRGPGRDRAMVFQDYALLPWRTVEQNVRFGLEMQGRVDGTTRERVAQAIRLVGLSGFEDAYPRELSGGMRQRVGLARALVTEPDILLMDEPFAAVDAITRELMQDELLRIIAATGQTVVFVTHSVDEAITLADRIVVVTDRPGRVRAELPVAYPRPRTSQTVRAMPGYPELRERIWELLKGRQQEAPVEAAERGERL